MVRVTPACTYLVLYGINQEKQEIPRLHELAMAWDAGGTMETGYKANMQLLFGPKTTYKPYFIIHVRHAFKWVVDYTKNGETHQIHSPFEFCVAYINNKLLIEQRRRQSVYLIFVEPENEIQPYPTPTTGV